jgi:sulfonate transport system substrate-binding protein
VEEELYSVAFAAARRNQLETARLLGVSRNVVRARLIEQGTLSGPLRRAPANRRRERVVRIGYQKLGLLMLLKQTGALEQALKPLGVGVRWFEYEGGIQIVAALKAGELDVAGVGNGPAVVAQAERVPIVYVAAEPPAPHAAGLVVPANSRVRSVAELRGARVLVNRGAQAHYLLMCALEEVGLPADAVDVCFEPPERALSAFRAGEVDAWAIWDPFLSSARFELGARLLRDATGLAENSTYYVAERAFAQANNQVLRELWNQLGRIARFTRADREQAATRLAPELGFTARALLASFQRELEPIPVNAELLAAQQDVANTLYRLQVIQSPVNVSDAAWDLRLAG